MGYIDDKALKKLKEFNNNINIENYICEECIMAKSIKQINHKMKNKNISEYIELIQSDL